MTKEKIASNFELNVIKIGIHTIQLAVGDKFETNGSTFLYVPSTKENKGKGKYRRWEGRSNSISVKKYRKDVQRADNIELVEDRLMYVDANGNEHRYKIWEVKYVYEIEQVKSENLILLVIEKGNFYNQNGKWSFKTQELEVQRETEQNYFLIKTHPITHHTQIPKSDLKKIKSNNYSHHVLCHINDYNEIEIELFKEVEKSQNDKIKYGHEIVKKETENLNSFLELKAQQGY